MKAIFKFFCMLLFVVNFLESSAQSYTPFPYSNAVWTVYYDNSGNQGGCDMFMSPCSTIFKIEKDTLFNGIQYQKLNNGGALRQNVPQKKIYYLPPGELKDTLLYDFDLEVNDALPDSYIYNSANYPCTGGTKAYVSSIDSILIGSKYYRRFNLSGCAINTYLIEGVGSNKGLLERLEAPFEMFIILACYNYNKLPNTNLFLVSCTNPDGLLSKSESKERSFTISPNPAYKNSQITFKTKSEIKSIEIYDSSGQKIHSYAGSINDDINLGIEFHSGIYCIIIETTENKTFLEKLVVE